MSKFHACCLGALLGLLAFGVGWKVVMFIALNFN